MDGGEGLIHVYKVISKIVKKYLKVLTGIINDIRNTYTKFKALNSKVEEKVCKHLHDHLDSIAGSLYYLLNLTERGYQKLINSLSWHYHHQRRKHKRIRLHGGRRCRGNVKSRVVCRKAKVYAPHRTC
jgi:hypothetical protein